MKRKLLKYKKSFQTRKRTETIKDRVLRDIKNLFEREEEENYKRVIFGVTITLNTKVTMIEIKHYQLRNILIKFDHI